MLFYAMYRWGTLIVGMCIVQETKYLKENWRTLYNDSFENFVLLLSLYVERKFLLKIRMLFAYSCQSSP